MIKKSVWIVSVFLYTLCILVSVYLIVLVFFLLRTEFLPKRVKITEEPVCIEDEYVSPSNFSQIQSDVVLGTYNGKLYFCTNQIAEQRNKTRFHQYLSVFDNGTAERIKKVDWVCGITNGFAYYLLSQGSNNYNLYCYNLETRNSTFLATVEGNSLSESFFKNDLLFVPTNSSCVEYYVVNGCDLLGTDIADKTYVLNDIDYVIEDRKLLCNGGAVNLSNIVSIGYDASIIPCDYGLLIHNSFGTSNILYLITKNDGRIVELFTIPCVGSRSAVAIYNDVVYVSFERYEKAGGFGLLPFDDDTLHGTYCISLEDYTAEKISNNIYNGMYIFDDTGIYASNQEGHIYKLDFEGNIIMSLLE